MLKQTNMLRLTKNPSICFSVRIIALVFSSVDTYSHEQRQYPSACRVLHCWPDQGTTHINTLCFKQGHQKTKTIPKFVKRVKGTCWEAGGCVIRRQHQVDCKKHKNQDPSGQGHLWSWKSHLWPVNQPPNLIPVVVCNERGIECVLLTKQYSNQYTHSQIKQTALVSVVGGFNPSEKICLSNWKNLPRGEHFQNIWNHHVE